jgi:hypothetical protein
MVGCSNLIYFVFRFKVSHHLSKDQMIFNQPSMWLRVWYGLFAVWQVSSW